MKYGLRVAAVCFGLAISLIASFPFVMARVGSAHSGVATDWSPPHLMHKKLFQIFFPAEQLNLTTAQKAKSQVLEEEIWQNIKDNSTVQNGLWLLATSPYFYGTDTERLTEVFYHRFTDDNWRNYLRRAATQLRALYLILIYQSDFAAEFTRYQDIAPPAISRDLEKLVSEFQTTFVSQFDRKGISLNAVTHEIQSTKGEFDYLIVGSGPAGSTLAHTLRERGKTVMLVERGSLPVPGAVDAERLDAFIESRNRRTSTSGSIIIRNANAVGGGTSVNIDLAFAPTLPTIARRWQSWREQKLVDASVFSDAEIAGSYAWVVDAIGTRHLAESEINANNHILWDGSQRMNWPAHLYDLNRYKAGEKPNQFSQKISALTALTLGDLSNRGNPLYLEPDAEVKRILWSADGHSAVGVTVLKRSLALKPGVTDLHGLNLHPGQEYSIKAKRVILSAGSLGSATILLREGLESDLPALGKGIILHPSLPVISEFEHNIDVMSGLTASVYNDHFALVDGFILESMAAPPEYGAIMFPASGKQIFETMTHYRKLGGFGVMLIDTPTATNRIFLNSRGEPEVDYDLSPGDKNRLRKGLKVAIQIAFAAGAKRVILPSIEPRTAENRPISEFSNSEAALRAADTIEFISNKTTITSAHMQGSVKMGSSPADSVVNSLGKVWGKEHLYVIDSSIFPTSVGANPMQSIYMMARLLGKRLP